MARRIIDSKLQLDALFSTFLIILPPVHNPRLNPLYIALHLFRSITRQFDHYLLVVRISGFLQEDLHDFRVEVFLQLCFGVISEQQLELGLPAKVTRVTQT